MNAQCSMELVARLVPRHSKAYFQYGQFVVVNLLEVRVAFLGMLILNMELRVHRA